ncbi:hypothetical protein D5R40_16040 [Okeania hirsuta]|uniref:Uncharacterized protein n=1 Tax=Okeania hirsuta TaxID=1458930 RepID=A0A3N6PB65_9CYAN|nr:hypothetical protein D4Z78_04975 [Okeania hirsuta]RQH40822.1 hypothetical protein D5R40_16040 [Okeania hirsuta]
MQLILITLGKKPEFYSVTDADKAQLINTVISLNNVKANYLNYNIGTVIKQLVQLTGKRHN